MSDDRVFMMGKFEARFPADRAYAKNHMWGQPTGEGDVVRFGFSAYAVRLLQDVYFLDWDFAPPVELRQRQEIGQIESSKAESALYSPVTGRLTDLNQDLLSDPSMINVDGYDRGWLFAVQCRQHELLSLDEYMLHLEAAWQIAQRTIKGQMNE